MPNTTGSGPDRDTLDPSVDPSPISNLHVKSLADLARMAEHLPVRWDALPRVPFYGGLMGYSDEWYRAAVGLGVLETRWRGQRELTPDEVQAVAGQTAKAVVTMSYELPALVATTYALERRGRATFRFPFYQPNSATFNPDCFPAQGRFAALQGLPARATWHMLRASLYGSLSHWGLRMVFASYALSVKSVEFERDPRLADLRVSVKEAMAARASARRRHQEGGPYQQQQQLPGVGGASQQRQQSAAPPPLPPQAAGAYAGDADPTAFQQEEQQQQQQQQQRSQPSTQQPWPQQQQQQAPQPPQQEAAFSDAADYDLDGFDDEGYHDDASPVAASEARRKRWQRASSSHNSTTDGSDGSSSFGDNGSGGGGSAWDRVRDQAAHGVAAGTTPAARRWAGGWRKGGPAGGEAQQQQQAGAPAPTPAADRDYVFDAATEEKTFARQQAQKEFDAMMEKERRGESDTRPTRR